MKTKLDKDEFIRLILDLLPECFICDECGPLIKVDEEGCCVTCGIDARIISTKDLLVLK